MGSNTHIVARRYDRYRDGSGSWTFDIGEYEDDLSSLVPGGVAADPTPEEAYRMTAYLEGLIEEQQRAATRSDEVLDRFDAFESTVELKAVAMALREIAEGTDV